MWSLVSGLLCSFSDEMSGVAVASNVVSGVDVSTTTNGTSTNSTSTNGTNTNGQVVEEEHEEEQYLALIRKIIDTGFRKGDRYETGRVCNWWNWHFNVMNLVLLKVIWLCIDHVMYMVI